MVEGRKQAISLRVSSSDLNKVKRLAQRLGARDSDVIRFAVKTTLARLAPLCDGSLRGNALVSVFLESGFDFFRHFDLDAARLDSIINEGVDDAHRIKPEDIQLIALNGIQQAYARLGLRDKQQDTAGNPVPGVE
jgi:hypothetical protein